MGEKSRFCSQFVSHVLQPVACVEPSKYLAFMPEEFGRSDSSNEELWYQFYNDRKRQFLAMSMYLVPLDQIRQIITTDFPALAPLVDRPVIKLDTSDLHGDERAVYSEVETDRYIDCWRTVVGNCTS